MELGEEIIISNRGIPVALVPFRTSSNRQASLGLERGRFIVPEDFNAPMPEILVDTQCWLWWFAQPERLNEEASAMVQLGAQSLFNFS